MGLFPSFYGWQEKPYKYFGGPRFLPSTLVIGISGIGVDGLGYLPRLCFGVLRARGSAPQHPHQATPLWGDMGFFSLILNPNNCPKKAFLQKSRFGQVRVTPIKTV